MASEKRNERMTSMMKKIIALCLFLSLLASVLAVVPAAKAQRAAVVQTVKVSTSHAQRTEEASVDIVLCAESKRSFFAMQGLLVYDKTRLELVTDENGAPIYTNGNGFVFSTESGLFEEYTEEHALAFTVKTENGKALSYSRDTVCFTLTFRVKEDAPLGDGYVRLISLTDKKASTSLDMGGGSFADVYYEDGKVNVMPNGYRPLPFESANHDVITVVDGVRTSFGVVEADTNIPGMMLENGRVTVAWKSGDRYYLPGEAITLTGNITLEAVTVAVPKTERGAAIKITPNPNDTALRFKVTMSANDLDAIRAIFGEENVSYGMLLAPQQNIDFVGDCSFEAFEPYVKPGRKPPYYDVPMASDEYYEKKNGICTLTGMMEGWTDDNLKSGVRVNAVAYITVTLGEESFTVYGEDDFSAARDVGYVVSCALDAYLANRALYTDDQIIWLRELKRRCEAE